jgi:hypothetical protein
MEYIKVQWLHSHPDEPILLYSELDDARWEIRKVELFPDGSVGYASAKESAKSTRLGLVPVPPLEEIAEDPEFEPLEITKGEFEQVWSTRARG